MIAVACAVWLAGSLASPLLGQSEPRDEANVAKPLPGVLDDVTLPLAGKMYLEGEDGQPRFVPNVSMTELLELRNQKIGAGQFSAFEFERVEVTVAATNEAADVDGRFTVGLSPGVQSTEVPLAFGSVQLGVERPEMDRENLLSQFAIGAGGYRWILLRTSDLDSASSHSIRLRGKTRVLSEADRRTLRISLPTHPCVLNISLPASAIDERVRNEDVVERSTSDAGVQLKILSRGGEFTLSWRSRDVLAQAASVEADSKTTFEIIDPQDTWRATTQLNVRWFGNNASKQFRIALPKGARWRGFPQSDFDRFSIMSVAASSDEQDNATDKVKGIADGTESDESAGPTTQSSETLSSESLPSETLPNEMPRAVELVIENFDTTKSATLDLVLDWEWEPGATGQSSSAGSQIVETKIPGLSVSGLSVHRGTIDCVYPPAYTVTFTEGSGIQLVQQSRSMDGFGSQKLQFAFNRHPFELDVAFRNEQSVPTVRPVYRVDVDENKLVMTAWLDCSFDVNQQRIELGMLFGDWILQENTARALASVEDPFSSEGDVLKVRRLDDGSYIISGNDPESNGFGAPRRVEQVWRLVAERSWTPDEDSELQFQVPELISLQDGVEAQRDHGAGALLVSGAANLLLKWRSTASTGLLSDSFSTEYQRFSQQNLPRKPLAYRFQSRGTTPTWSGQAELLERAMSVQEQVDVEVLDSLAVVTQDYAVQIANEPLDACRIAIPTTQLTSSPQFFVNGNFTSAEIVATVDWAELQAMLAGADEPTTSANSTETEASPRATDQTVAEILPTPQVTPPSIVADQPPSQWTIYRLVGMPALIGNSQIRVRTSIKWSKSEEPTSTTSLDPAGSSETPISLTPSELGRVARKTVLFRVPLARLLAPVVAPARRDLVLRSGLQVERVEVAGASEPTIAPGTTREAPQVAAPIIAKDESVGLGAERAPKLATVSTSSRTLKIADDSFWIRITPDLADINVTGIRVGLSWLQTAISGDERRDRFAAEIESAAAQLSIKLPAQADVRNYGVLLDGDLQNDAFYDSTTDTLVIKLPSDLLPAKHVIEIFYPVRVSLSSLTSLDVAPPQIMDAEYAGRFYWQLATPKTQHLGWAPQPLTAEWRWQWSGLWWARESARDERALVELLGAADVDQLPVSANQYLMSGRHPAATFRVWVISRFVIWFPIGTMAIAISALVINVPLFRKPVCGFMLAGAVAIFAIVFPDLGVLLGQTAVISLGLVALVFTTQAAVESRVRRRSVFTTRPSTYVDASGNVPFGRRSATGQLTPSAIGEADSKPMIPNRAPNELGIPSTAQAGSSITPGAGAARNEGM